MRWQQTFEEILGHANEILAAQFGIRLAAEYRSWSYRAQPGATLTTTLAELAAQDPGGDVFTVIGLTSSLSLVTATFEQLGVASTPGRHFMLRGYDDVGERAAFDRAFRELKTDEREALYKARRRHKTVAVFLHELAHNLGCPHRAEADTLMSPTYSDHATSFDVASRATMQTTIDQRLGRTRPVTPTRNRMRIRRS